MQISLYLLDSLLHVCPCKKNRKEDYQTYQEYNCMLPVHFTFPLTFGKGGGRGQGLSIFSTLWHQRIVSLPSVAAFPQSCHSSYVNTVVKIPPLNIHKNNCSL